MTESSSQVSSSHSIAQPDITQVPNPQTPDFRGRALRYLFLAILANSGIWGAALLYLNLSPTTYTSEWSLLLPGTGIGTNINIAELGQASASVDSPYSGTALDPRVNYKAIAESDVVLQQAAQSLNMTVEEFGDPKIELEEQTALMEFNVQGKTPEEAQLKSLTLYDTFQAQLEQLRQQEIALRQEGARVALQEFQRQLENAQQRLLSYQTQSGVVSPEQFQQIASNLEDLRKQQIELLAEQQRTFGQVQQLTTSLGISPDLATKAFILQADPLFQQLLKDYAESSAALTVNLSKWGVNHPRVVEQQEKQQATRSALLQRGTALIDSGDEATLQLLNLSSDDNRASLFRDLVSGYAEQQGVSQQMIALNRQINELQNRLVSETQRAARLSTLQRDIQVAETVFSTAIASSNIGQTNIYASYPFVQLLTKPSLPEKPSSPQPKFVLAGAALGSLFITLGLILLWIRKPFVHRILRNV